MAQRTSRNGTVVPTSCHACGGERELVRNGERTAARCAACGSVEEVALVCTALEKWSVVDPDGTVQTFATKAELLDFVQAPAKEEATAGPKEDAPKEDAPKEDAPKDVLAKEDAPTEDAPKEDAPKEDAPKDSGEDVSKHVTKDDDDSAAPISKATDSSADVAVLSVRDLTVVAVPPLPPGARASLAPPAVTGPPPPLPPKARALATLPPPMRHDLAPPPPPSIDVGRGSDLESVAATSDAPPASETHAKKQSTRATPNPSMAPAAAQDAEEPKRGWLLPAAAVALVVGSIAYAVRSSPTPSTPPQTEATPPEMKATTAPPGASSVATLAAAADASAPDAASAADAATADATTASVPATSASAEKSEKSEKAPSDAGAKADAAAASSTDPSRAGDEKKLSLPELLTRASAARRAGDSARARVLLDRALVVSPGNVEAITGLGDLSRAGGDLAGAKASYEKALATSPSYSPALLGLADALWDLGDRAGAQRQYRTLVGQSSLAPERAKTRAAGGAAGTSSTSPTPAVRPLTSADLPAPAKPTTNP